MHPLLVDIEHTQASETSMHALREALSRAQGPLRRPGSDGRTIVTFVWIGDADSVALHCGLVHHGRSTAMSRVPCSDVWWLDAETDADTMVSYRYVLDDPFLGAGALDDAEWQRRMLAAHERSFADPFNDHRLPPLAALFGLAVAHEQHESILMLPKAPDVAWFASEAPASGTFDRFEHVSASMGDTRDITVYATGHRADVEAPLVVLLDGSSWLAIADLPRAVDAAVHTGHLAPPVVAFVHEAHGSDGFVDRVRELSCNPAHAAMLADELMPTLRSRYRVAGPERTVIGGASLGGLAATYTALEHHHAAHLVLSISGSHWYGTERDGSPEWLTRRLTTSPDVPTAIYQQIGRLEDGPLALSPGVSHLAANRHFRDAAVARGIRVEYDEMGTAHDIAAFRVAAMRGLLALLPPTVR